MTTSDSERTYDLAPNLAASEKSYNRYPNQFFDLSQQYMPPTIKELFKWCTFYYYNSPLIGSAMKKVSRYPITDLIIEDEHDTVVDLWEKMLNKNLKLKVRLMEINLDRHVYGNCFVSIHLPTTRTIKCPVCAHTAPIEQWDWKYTGSKFRGKCSECETEGDVTVKDTPYKDPAGIRILRWNPENIEIKYNEYTGKSTYLYTPPKKLRMAIESGDKDILEDMPLIVLKAVAENKKIKLNQNNFQHLKAPTLAEQDQGWGKPSILHVLKDMFYFYTLRRAQEAIALEHVVPFDIIYPMPNAQMDPFVHSDLAEWRGKVEHAIKRHRRDPNYKAVMPVPVGFGRLGGDGKALMLGPELQYLTQTIVGGMGIPQEFLFGGLNWTGSSVSLRTLENDFIQNRTELLDLVEWIKDKVRAWMRYPDVKEIRFADFRMADDVQKNQQLIGLNAQGKVSDHTLLTELGYDYEEELKKRLEEVHIQNHMSKILTQGQAKSQGEASIIAQNYQDRLTDMSVQAQQAAQKKIEAPLENDHTGQIGKFVEKLLTLPKPEAESVIADLKMQVPQIASPIEKAYREVKEGIEERQRQEEQLLMQQEQAMMGMAPEGAPQEGAAPALPASEILANQQQDPQAQAQEQATQMRAMPEQQPPRRQGGV